MALSMEILTRYATVEASADVERSVELVALVDEPTEVQALVDVIRRSQ